MIIPLPQTLLARTQCAAFQLLGHLFRLNSCRRRPHGRLRHGRQENEADDPRVGLRALTEDDITACPYCRPDRELGVL
ncbi:DUF6233 domain-containing protein [Streptomyces sp. NPDC001999]